MNHLSALFLHIEAWILSMGYIGVVLSMIIEGLGVPFPGDAFLAFYGYAAATGRMSFVSALCFGVLGYGIGTSLAFFLMRMARNNQTGASYAYRLFSEARVNRTLAAIDHYRVMVLVVGRFIPGIRTLSSYAAGISTMAYSTFLCYTLGSAILWCGMWIYIGYWFGENVKEILANFERYLLLLSLVAAVIFLFMWWRRHRSMRLGE